VAYEVRWQAVALGRARPAEARVLVAAFKLASGGAACLQLQDDGGRSGQGPTGKGQLRRGGVYLAERDDPACPAVAPRFDELFAVLLRLRGRPEAAARAGALLREARAAAAATRPRLEPAALAELERVAAAAAAASALHPPAEGEETTLEALVVACLLIFVSEEERYPPPKGRGGAVALETLLEVLEGPVGRAE
jgi:hypothetical protein